MPLAEEVDANQQDSISQTKETIQRHSIAATITFAASHRAAGAFCANLWIFTLLLGIVIPPFIFVIIVDLSIVTRNHRYIGIHRNIFPFSSIGSITFSYMVGYWLSAANPLVHFLLIIQLMLQICFLFMNISFCYLF